MTSSLKDLCILVVENEYLLAADLEATMRNAGASRVEMAASLSDAQLLADCFDFDAAILDIRLMDGESLPLAQKLIKRDVPVVIHSGHLNQAHETMMPEAVFLPKPSTPTEIVRSVLRARGVVGAFDLPEIALPVGASARQ